MDKSDPREIVTTRVIDATREEIFAAHEHPERLTRWWGPNGFTSTFEHFDFRPGGEWKFSFHGPDGKDYPNHVVFRAIERPSRIVLEHVAPHFSLEMLFTREAERTRITWHQRFPTPEMREEFAPVCVPSNEQNLDRLEAELKRI
jgi:uncharacterized protein YndB with AHSA1/START domain